jgi:hypothetical protein
LAAHVNTRIRLARARLNGDKPSEGAANERAGSTKGDV